MRKPTINSDSVAQDQIRAFVERIMRMRQEAKAVKDDIREIYNEAKGQGFDKTVLGQVVLYVEKRTTKASELLEAEAVFELYLSAFDGKTGTVIARAHTHENSAATGERHSQTQITTTEVAADPDRSARPALSSDQSTAARMDGHGLNVSGSTPAGPDAPMQAGRAVATTNAEPTQGPSGTRSGYQAPPVDTHSQHDAGNQADSGPQAAEGLPYSETREGAPTAGEASSLASSVVPFRTKVAERPEGCLHPTVCAGTWRGRCHECQTAFTTHAVEIPHHGSVA